jgi:hypothetical protein
MMQARDTAFRPKGMDALKFIEKPLDYFFMYGHIRFYIRGVQITSDCSRYL